MVINLLECSDFYKLLLNAVSVLLPCSTVISLLVWLFESNDATLSYLLSLQPDLNNVLN